MRRAGAAACSSLPAVEEVRLAFGAEWLDQAKNRRSDGGHHKLSRRFDAAIQQQMSMNSSQIAVFLQQSNQIGDLLGMGGGGGELVSELNNSAAILALSSA